MLNIKHNSVISEVCPLTNVQKGMYIECLDAPESLMYNIPVLCTLPDWTDMELFEKAIKTVAKKHKILNTVIASPNGVPSMIYKEKEIIVTQKEVEDIDAATDAFITPFDLEKGPLYRFELLVSDGKKYLLADIHHVICDGTSFNALLRQIVKVYNGGTVEDEEITLFDLAKAELDAESGDEYKKEQKYFEEKLGGVDCDSRPVPDVIAEGKYAGSSRIELDVGKDLKENDVIEFVKKNNVSENALFLGAFGYALAKFNGANDSLFATVHNGRNDKRLGESVGAFVRTLPMYFSYDDETEISDYLKSVYDDYYKARISDSISFGELAEKYGVSTDVTFVYQANILSDTEFSGNKIGFKLVDAKDTQTDLNVMFLKVKDEYRVYANYRNELYTAEFVKSFVRMYINVILSMMRVKKIGDVEFCDRDSFAKIEQINKTECEYDKSKTVVELFAERVKETPDNICVVYCDKKYTYKEIDEITDKIAKYLVKNGVGREKVVGILIPRCEYMPICSLAVLKAGGAYLPLDPTYPKERLNLMVEDSGAMMLIYAPEYIDVIGPEFSGKRLSTDDIEKIEDCDEKLSLPKPDDLFVVLYTSGSTGTPKGVMFEHSNTSVTTEWVKRYYKMDENSRVTAYASYGFDANVFDTYPAITSGAQLHVISDEIRLDFIALRDYYNKNGITHTVMTTQVGRQFALLGGLETLEHISVAGEKLTPLTPPDGFRMYNLYGPSEGSVVTSEFYIDKYYKDIPIGKAVDNLKVYIVDKNGKLLPPFAVGELWISGPHVTRGYLNRPEKTEEAYGTNPFSNETGYERVYRTGDIVRLMNDVNMQFIGRRDAQVKVRGFRVELTEVEEIIRRFDGIKDVTVAAFDDVGGGKFIAAYVVSDSPVSNEDLADFIRAEKPPYMVPAVIMQIDAIPLNQNQKVNKKALPIPQRDLGEIVPPENDTQKKIFDIVSDVVGHRDFGITTNIYDAGLTSIGAVKLNVELAEAFSVPIKIADIKSNDTVKLLEKFISASAPSETYAVLDDYPITESQSGIFIESMSAPDTTVYNIPVLIKISDDIDTEKLKDAVTAAINAHPYIKTVLFTDDSGNVRAKRQDDAKVNVCKFTCKSLPQNSEIVRPFKLINEPLYRVSIYETESGNYLFMDIHHIISDGTSIGILFRDIDRSYSGEELETERFSGYEAALEEEKTRQSEQYEDAKKYWDGVLNGCETSCLPKYEAETSSNGAGSVSYAENTDATAIIEFCENEKLSLNAFFNGVFAFVLSRFANKENLTYGSVYNGRNDSRLSESVTLLARTIPVVADFSEDIKIIDYVKNMQKQLIDGMANDACSFAELAHNYGIKSDIILAYQGDNFDFNSLCGKKAEIVTIPLDAAKAPISVNINLKDNKFEYIVEYRSESYNKIFAECLADSISACANSFTRSEKLSEVSMLSEKSEKIYDTLNNSDLKVEDVSCVELFERNAKKCADKVAVVAAGESLTFKELNEKANQVAHKLLKLGVKQNDIIGMVLERTKEVLICEFGIMKAGGAFLPILPTYPDDRINYSLENAESPYVITTEKIKAERGELFASEKPYKAITVEELVCGNDTENPNVNIDFSQLAYCIYTSGSTGTPKGVMINHGNFSNFLQTQPGIYKYYDDENNGSALSLSSISFDMSIMELLLPLCNGKRLCVATEDECHNPLELKELMIKNDVEMIICTPSFMNNMIGMTEFVPALKSLKTLLVGAEAFPTSLYEALAKEVPDLQIVNGYGPTETTICCSTKELLSAERITIGKPTGNVKMYVLDRYGNVLPPYGIGELIICGDGVGDGYVKLEDKTKAAFFRLRDLPAYHSGDLVRLNGDAEIDFGGRIDNQVKLRGFRVELDEIENVMIDYEPVLQSKVLVRNNGTEDYLVGFFTASKLVDIDELTAHMKAHLTYYMVPSVLMQLDKMPLTPNGKIDKKAFPQVEQKKERKKGRRAAKKSLEQELCEIFASVLSLDEVFADDNFFELGGTSLSASKVTMMLMSKGVEVKYGDIFDYPTPETLAEFVETRDGVSNAFVSSSESGTGRKTEMQKEVRPALQWNKVKFAKEVHRESLGNVLLTGAVGFLGIHILNEFLKSETGHIWCLVRKGRHESAEIRLKSMLIYYFGRGFDDELKNRITVVEADITDAGLAETLKDIPFDTVINSAACVKHFADDDILDRINIKGVENLIAICQNRKKKLVQISTVSVPGIHTDESYEKQIRMHEDELFVIDDMDNKYAISKYQAELRMLDAIENGLRGKIIRVGNLMGRHSDGEFQANIETNMFLSGIRGFAIMGKYPISHMTDPMSFSPIDCTAKAVLLLSGTNDKFTAFNANSRYGFDEMKIIDACNRNGISIYPEDDEVYYEEFRQKLGDDSINEKLNGLAAYDIKDAHAVETDNLFTTNILYRIGFSWPLVDDSYLDRAINSIMTLDYFNVDDDE